jgi:hypothetical protein
MTNVKKCLSLALIFLLLSACAAHQPIRPIVQQHPSQYKNFYNHEGISIAVIPCHPGCSVYSNPGECTKLKYTPIAAGICPTRIIIFNESESPVYVDPSQITCSDLEGTTYLPFDSSTAATTVIESESFKQMVRGAFTGAVVGAAIGAGIGALLGAAMGGRSMAGYGAGVGAASGGIAGSAGGAEAFRKNMENNITTEYTNKALREIDLPPNGRTEGLVFLPAIQIDSVQMLIESKTIDIPLQY